MERAVKVGRFAIPGDGDCFAFARDNDRSATAREFDRSGATHQLERSTAAHDDVSRYCPVCSQRLESRRCKLICPVCGYYMSCADYY